MAEVVTLNRTFFTNINQYKNIFFIILSLNIIHNVDVSRFKNWCIYDLMWNVIFWPLKYASYRHLDAGHLHLEFGPLLSYFYTSLVYKNHSTNQLTNFSALCCNIPKEKWFICTRQKETNKNNKLITNMYEKHCSKHA